MKLLGIKISFDNLGDAISVAWRGYFALFVAMAVIFASIIIMSKLLKDKKSE